MPTDLFSSIPSWLRPNRELSEIMGLDLRAPDEPMLSLAEVARRRGTGKLDALNALGLSNPAGLLTAVPYLLSPSVKRSVDAAMPLMGMNAGVYFPKYANAPAAGKAASGWAKQLSREELGAAFSQLNDQLIERFQQAGATAEQIPALLEKSHKNILKLGNSWGNLGALEEYGQDINEALLNVALQQKPKPVASPAIAQPVAPATAPSPASAPPAAPPRAPSAEWEGWQSQIQPILEELVAKKGDDFDAVTNLTDAWLKLQQAPLEKVQEYGADPVTAIRKYLSKGAAEAKAAEITNLLNSERNTFSINETSETERGITSGFQPSYDPRASLEDVAIKHVAEAFESAPTTSLAPELLPTERASSRLNLDPDQIETAHKVFGPAMEKSGQDLAPTRAFAQRVFENKSFSDIAKELGVSDKKTAYRIVQRGRELVQANLKDQGVPLTKATRREALATYGEGAVRNAIANAPFPKIERPLKAPPDWQRLIAHRYFIDELKPAAIKQRFPAIAEHVGDTIRTVLLTLAQSQR